MVARCHNPGASDYGRYGGRGVTVHVPWRESFEAFLAEVGERPHGTTLDRIDSHGDYEPGNVRWATPREQARNRRTARLLSFRGRTQSLIEWSEETGIRRVTIAARLRKGWTVEEALTVPLIDRAERGRIRLRGEGVTGAAES